MAPRNWCMPLQKVDFPDPGGPMTSWAKGMMVEMMSREDVEMILGACGA